MMRQKQALDRKMEENRQELDGNRRVKEECEYRANKMSEENEKMHKNYDILKEHELNIIRDFQDKKMADQKELEGQIIALKAQLNDRDETIKERSQENQDL